MSESNVTPLFKSNGRVADNAGAAEQLRHMADAIEAGEWGDVRTVLCIIEFDGQVGELAISKGPLDAARAVGLLNFGIKRLMP